MQASASCSGQGTDSLRPMTTMDWVTLTIAVYGAVVSSFTAYLYWREQAALVDVDLEPGFVAEHRSGSVSDDKIFVTARNPGETHVNLNTPCFRLPDGPTAYPAGALQGFVDFPHRLEPKDSCTTWVSAKELADWIRDQGYSGVVDLVAVYPDAIGNEHTSDPMPFTLEDWT